MKSKRLSVAVSFSVLFFAAACSSSRPAAHESAAEPAPHQATHEAAPRTSSKGVKPGRPAPAGSKFSKIEVGMADTDVRRILGEPDSSKDYVTGKQFIPYYYGTDTARTEYIYHGQGRITLSRNRYSGGLKVVRVDYDPGI